MKVETKRYSEKELDFIKNNYTKLTVPDVIVNAEVVERIASIINVDVFELKRWGQK